MTARMGACTAMRLATVRSRRRWTQLGYGVVCWREICLVLADGPLLVRSPAARPQAICRAANVSSIPS